MPLSQLRGTRGRGVLAQLAAAGPVVEISDHQFCGFTDILNLLNQEIFTMVHDDSLLGPVLNPESRRLSPLQIQSLFFE